ncbi:MAG TPA: hypothetical protein VFW87_00770 [Pirellulales bacterium]|nr:hypothetical protein [Pirellulales bacterium]
MDTTESSPTTPASAARHRGRGWLWLGVGLCLISFAFYFVQAFQFKHLVTPWYMPILFTLGVLLTLVSVRQRPTWARVTTSLVLALLCAGEWYFMLSMSLLPPYTGPLQIGKKIPKFATTLADGSSFTDQDLRKGGSTVLVFYRGHW